MSTYPERCGESSPIAPSFPVAHRSSIINPADTCVGGELSVLGPSGRQRGWSLRFHALGQGSLGSTRTLSAHAQLSHRLQYLLLILLKLIPLKFEAAETYD